MNNRGQTLVLFVILIPVIILLFVAFYQAASVKLEEQKIENSIESALEYGLEHLEEDNLFDNIKEMIMINNNELTVEDIEITVIDDGINIKVKKEYSIAFVMDDEIIFDYTGKLVDGNIVIKENRG